MSEVEFEARSVKRMPKKRKHVTLTIQEKLDIISQVEAGTCSRQSVAMKYGIGKSTVHDIHKRKEAIRMFAALNNSDDVGKRRRVDLKATEKIPRVHVEEVELKQEEESADDEVIEPIEEFDYQELADENYEVVYEANSPNEDEVQEKPKPETTLLSKSKRKSKTLTFREKYDVIQQIESGTPVTFICESYGIGRTTCYDYMRRKQEIAEFVEKSNDKERKTFKKSKFPDVENRVLNWCELNEVFTKQDFYDCAKSAFDDAREQSSSLSASGFCGSWSWAKRFFHRHPDLKRKLVSASGEPLDPAELSLTYAEYLDDNDENNETSMEVSKKLFVKNERESLGKKIKFLNLSEKLEVLNDIDNGMPIVNIAAKFDVSKSTIYDFYKRRLEIRDTKLNSQQKVTKTPRFPQLELELLQWCLKQKNFPLSNVLIADKALCLFDELMLTGNFNPSSSWAKKFVLRHPELCEKQGIAVETEVPEFLKDESFQHDFEDEDEMTEDSSFKFNAENSYEEEYIVEELDAQADEELEIETVVKAEVIAQKNILNICKKDVNSMEIPDSIALKSLKILIKYSEQRGHDSMLSQLIEYQSQLQENVT